MNKHLVFSHTFNNNLKSFFTNRNQFFLGKIVNILDDFTIGPLKSIDKPIGRHRRVEWLRSYYMKLGEDITNIWLEGLASADKRILKDLTADTNIYLWHTNDLSSKIGVKFVCYLLRNYNLNIYECDISKLPSYEMPENERIMIPLQSLSHENIEFIFKNRFLISGELKNEKINNWKKLIRRDSSIRIINNERIVSVDENFVDQHILINMDKDYKDSAEIINHIGEKEIDYIRDHYIKWRITELIKKGDIVPFDNYLRKQD